MIYQESKKNGITFTITNDTDRVQLLQARVLPEKNGKDIVTQVPFIVVPPLKIFEPGDTLTLHIRKTDHVVIDDRESQWLLALKTIPAQQGNNGNKETESSLVLALQNNLRLFFRPESLLEITVAERAEKLLFEQREGYLIVTNPTPYYITINTLFIDGVLANTSGKRTIKPYESTNFLFQKKIKVVTWTMIGDDGMQTEPFFRDLP